MSRSLFAALVAGDMDAAAFLPADFRDPDARRAAVRSGAARQASPHVLEAIAAGHHDLESSPARAAHLEALGRPGSAAVVTGQQVGLFLGPLYTVYKAASAIVLARRLQEETGVRCVPVFWLASEDHDFAEIDHCFVPEPAAPLRLEMAGDRAGRISVGQCRLDDSIDRAHARLAEAVGHLPHAAPFLAELKKHYRKGNNLAVAFGGLLSTLFAEEGLLVLDPRRPCLARATGAVHRRAIQDAAAIDEVLAERARALATAGFDVQVKLRPGSPLVFHYAESAAGPRFRLRPASGGYLAGPGSDIVTRADLLALVESDPARFSSSALLRPIVQDSLLPTAAYVGGPAEVSYFGQLGPLYDQYELPMPLVAPRARFRCLEPTTHRLLDTLGITPEEVEGPREALIARLASRTPVAGPPPAELALKLRGELERQLDEFDAFAAPLNPSLHRAVERTRASVARATDRLVRRYERALVEREHTTTERIDRLRGQLYPNDAPQERVLGLPYFACRYGARPFLEKIFARLDPFSAAVTDVDL